MKGHTGLTGGLAACVLAVMLCGSGHAQQAGGAKAETTAPQAAKEKPAGRVATLVSEWERARLGAKEYIEAMPEEGIAFKPTPEVRSFAEQMLHIAGSLYMFGSVVSGKENPYDMFKGKNPEKMEELKASKAALLGFVLGSYDYVIDAVKAQNEPALGEDVQFFKMTMSRELLLAKALEHHAHHRGQTTIYLRLKGVTPPSERLF